MGEQETAAERDQRLVRAANGGDRAAFEALYRANKDRVLGMALRFTPHRDDAEDAVAEAFAYVLRKLPDLELTGRLTSLLYPVVKHAVRALDERRGRHSVGDAALADVLAPAEDPSDRTDPSDLERVLALLPAAQREVLLLRVVDDFSVEEVAAALEIPHGTVKSRLHHALATLRADPRTRTFFED